MRAYFVQVNPGMLYSEKVGLLKHVLKVPRVGAALILTGSVFHNFGANTTNALWPVLTVLACGVFMYN